MKVVTSAVYDERPKSMLLEKGQKQAKAPGMDWPMVQANQKKSFSAIATIRTQVLARITPAWRCSPDTRRS